MIFVHAYEYCTSTGLTQMFEQKNLCKIFAAEGLDSFLSGSTVIQPHSHSIQQEAEGVVGQIG